MPTGVPEHGTAHTITSKFASGVSVDQCAAYQAPQAQLDRGAAALVRLAVREFFEMNWMQTDPNFSNCLFDASTGKVVLLDFGAKKAVPTRARQLTALGRAMHDGDGSRVGSAAGSAGFISPEDPASQSQAVVQMLLAAGEPLRHADRTTLASRTCLAACSAKGAHRSLAVDLRGRHRPIYCFCSASLSAPFCNACACGPGATWHWRSRRTSRAPLLHRARGGPTGAALLAAAFALGHGLLLICMMT